MIRPLCLITALVLVACADAAPPEPADVSSDAAPAGDEEGYLLRCAACHGEDGRGTTVAPSLLEALDRSDDALIAIIVEGSGQMPPIVMPTEEAQGIVDYLRHGLADGG